MKAKARRVAPVPGAWRRPAAVGAAALGVVALVAARDPARGGYPPCPFRLATGLDCPGCGTLRALHALAAGDLGAAVGLNALVVLALPFVVWAYLAWLGAALGRPLPVPRLPPAVGWAAVAVALAFGVARNLAGPTSALAP